MKPLESRMAFGSCSLGLRQLKKQTELASALKKFHSDFVSKPEDATALLALGDSPADLPLLPRPTPLSLLPIRLWPAYCCAVTKH